MQSEAVRSATQPTLRPVGRPARAAFLGTTAALDRHAPHASTHALEPARFAPRGAGEDEHVIDELARFRPDVTVVFDPGSAEVAPLLKELVGATVGVLADSECETPAAAFASLDRVLAFDPALTGASVGGREVWRAIPPPVGEIYFGAPVRPKGAPRAITLGRSTEHREDMLMPAKHHHDLLQVLHGVTGERLAELLRGCDVGVQVSRDDGGGFGWQVGAHLASGQLLLSEELRPKHGLERNIDYLQFESADELVWVLERLARFPEMHHRIRVRGRLKAEQYRASRVFARITHDLLADVAAFGGAVQV